VSEEKNMPAKSFMPQAASSKPNQNSELSKQQENI